jgi:hypothetical protein
LNQPQKHAVTCGFSLTWVVGLKVLMQIETTTTEDSTMATTRTSRASRTSASKPAAAAKTTKPATKTTSPAQSKPTMTPSLWRSDPKRAQLSDEQIVAAVKEFAKEHSSQPIGAVSNWSDARIISLIGWTDTLNGALKKIRPIVASKTAA